jgi:integrase
MPRKPKLKKETITFQVGDKDVDVHFHPPTGNRKSWYVYWQTLKNPRSTGARTLDEAKAVARKMLRSGGKRQALKDTVLTDEEFEQIQRRHFSKKQDVEAQKRAEKSLTSCLEAISAFRDTSGVSPISTATADDCERFQHAALQLPKNWRSKYPKSKQIVETLSANTVLKWSVALQAAFERANRNAERKKCVRGVVPQEKLLTDNPWKHFTWIEGTSAPIRQFDGDELLSILDYLEQQWPCVAIAPLVAKVFLWSWGRKSEVTGLRWDMLRPVGDEVHFEIVGKWAVDKWFRIPKPLFDELSQMRTGSGFVFAAYTEQLRVHHHESKRQWLAEKVASEFGPGNLGDWFYERVRDWSKTMPQGAAYLHMFRKTSLQYARAGEDANQRVADDARLGERVMMTSYVQETDEEMRQKSNRTFERITNSLRADVALRYGFVPPKVDPLVERLNAAAADQKWSLVASISAELERRKRDQQAG